MRQCPGRSAAKVRQGCCSKGAGRPAVVSQPDIARRNDKDGQRRRRREAEYERDCEFLEDRIGENERRADHRRRGSEHDRLEPRRAGFDQCVPQRNLAVDLPAADEIDEEDRVADDNARERDEADHRRRGECGAEQPVSEHDADQGQRHRHQNDERQQERPELRHNQKVDAEDGHHEGRAHIAESHIGDFPLAVPEQGRPRVVDRLAVKFDLRRPDRAPIRLGDRVLNRQHAIDRGLETPGDLGRHHLGEASVMAEDRIGRPFAFDLHDVSEFDVRSLPGPCRRRATGSTGGARRKTSARLGSMTLMSIGFRPSPRCE